MNFRAIFRPLSLVMLMLAIAMLIPQGMALFESQATFHTQQGFAAGVLVTVVAASLLWLAGKTTGVLLGRKEGLLTVGLGWLLAGLFGALPLSIAGAIPGYLDAFFESVSGFTTTGATVLTDIEVMPGSILLWRSLMHWLGGAGVIVLFVAVLPMLGISGKFLYQMEASGPSKSALHPRIRDTAQTIWAIYLILTLSNFILLWAAGMSGFDAINHALSTMSTGGFSTRNGSLSEFGALAQWVTIVFMFLAATNFALYYQAARGRWLFWRDSEFRFYALLIVLATSVISVSFVLTRNFAEEGSGLLGSAFTAVSILTSTGFAAPDYEAWPPLAQGVLFLAAIVGGSAGSTTGAIKCVRILITLRLLSRYIVKLFRPQAIIPVRLGGRMISREVEEQVAGFILLYLAWLVMGALLLMASGHDVLTSLSASVSCQGCIGPGHGAVGPYDNYAGISAFGKLVLCVQMIAGRLELMAITVLLAPSFWRR